MINRSPTLTQTPEMPEFYVPPLPSDHQSADDVYQAIEVQIEGLVELLHQGQHHQWITALLDRYEALAHAYDAYAESLNDAQAQIILQRLQRQLKELHEYIETSPEDLWPRGP
jgi:septation ring formation regulator EzrA